MTRKSSSTKKTPKPKTKKPKTKKPKQVAKTKRVAKPTPKQRGGNGVLSSLNPFSSKINATVPTNPHFLYGKNKAPPAEGGSWYHYNSPLYQKFGGYTCIKTKELQALGGLLRDTMGNSG